MGDRSPLLAVVQLKAGQRARTPSALAPSGCTGHLGSKSRRPSLLLPCALGGKDKPSEKILACVARTHAPTANQHLNSHPGSERPTQHLCELWMWREENTWTPTCAQGLGSSASRFQEPNVRSLEEKHKTLAKHHVARNSGVPAGICTEESQAHG